jgi:CoA:oxalate CoA-transferase
MATVQKGCTMGDGAETTRARALDGIRVLDLTRFLSGPYATLLLAGMGAEVIRIDEPKAGDPTFDAPPFFGPMGISFQRQTPDDIGLAYLKRSRGKKAISLDLKSEAGHHLFLELVKQADVLVENFRVGITERLRVDYETLRSVNPRLIYCSITGYGSTGPDRHRKAYDLMVQAATGLMSITGDPQGQPSKTGAPLSDGIAGSFAVTGILGALVQRARTGVGQFVDVSMSDCLISLIFDEPFDSYDKLGLPHRQGNRIARFSPFNTYHTTDGSVAIGAATREDWTKLLKVMGRVDLLDCPYMSDSSWRLANNATVDALVGAWTGTLTTAQVISVLDAQDITCGPIRTVDEVTAWDHLWARGMFSRLGTPNSNSNTGPLAPGFPIKFSEADAGYSAPAPKPRQHNAEIYTELLNLDPAEIDRLSAKGVI